MSNAEYQDLRLTCSGCKQLISEDDTDHWRTCEQHPAHQYIERLKGLCRMARAQARAGHSEAMHDVFERIELL